MAPAARRAAPHAPRPVRRQRAPGRPVRSWMAPAARRVARRAPRLDDRPRATVPRYPRRSASTSVSWEHPFVSGERPCATTAPDPRQRVAAMQSRNFDAPVRVAFRKRRSYTELASRDRGKAAAAGSPGRRSEEHTSELQSQSNLVCRLLLEKKKKHKKKENTIRLKSHLDNTTAEQSAQDVSSGAHSNTITIHINRTIK